MTETLSRSPTAPARALTQARSQGCSWPKSESERKHSTISNSGTRNERISNIRILFAMEHRRTEQPFYQPKAVYIGTQGEHVLRRETTGQKTLMQQISEAFKAREAEVLKQQLDGKAAQ